MTYVQIICICLASRQERCIWFPPEFLPLYLSHLSCHYQERLPVSRIEGKLSQHKLHIARSNDCWRLLSSSVVGHIFPESSIWFPLLSFPWFSWSTPWLSVGRCRVGTQRIFQWARIFPMFSKSYTFACRCRKSSWARLSFCLWSFRRRTGSQQGHSRRSISYFSPIIDDP